MHNKISLDFFQALPFFLAVILLTGLTLASYHRNEVWHTQLRLWQDTVSKSPRKSRPFNSLGTVYARQGAYRAAIDNFKEAIANGSGNQEIHHFNLALAYERLGFLHNAVQALQNSLTINPDYADAHYRLALIYKNLGEWEKAESELIKASEILPGSDEYYNDLGSLYLMRKEYTLAVEQYMKSLEINPRNVEAMYNLALSFDKLKMKDQAINRYTDFLATASMEEYGLAKVNVTKRLQMLRNH